MKKTILFILLTAAVGVAQAQWINEVSYDNTGLDVDEFVEVVAEIGTDMSAYGIVIAKKSGGERAVGYAQLTGTVSATNGDMGFGFFVVKTDSSSSVSVPPGVTNQLMNMTHLRNGVAGVLLIDAVTGATVHGIWWEETGSTPATIAGNGFGPLPAGTYSMAAASSPPASILDGSSSAVGNGIAVTGDGQTGVYEETASTPGALNTNQSSLVSGLAVEMTSFTAVSSQQDVTLAWSTANETDNVGFEIERVYSGMTEVVGFVPGAGTDSAPRDYVFHLTEPHVGTMIYRLKSLDASGHFDYAGIVEVEIELAESFRLSQNFPNPFNPSTSFTVAVREAQDMIVSVHNVLGQRVAILHNGHVEGNQEYEFSFDASDLPSGVYLYRISGEKLSATRQMVLLK